MLLSQRLMMHFYSELLLLPRLHYKNVYQIKAIHSKLGDSILFSCRFKTNTMGTFLLSISICLKQPTPYVRVSVHQLCYRRIFSSMIYYKRIGLPHNESISGLLGVSEYNDYYKMHRQLPYKIMAGLFKHYLRKDLIDFINQLEKIDLGQHE